MPQLRHTIVGAIELESDAGCDDLVLELCGQESPFSPSPCSIASADVAADLDQLHAELEQELAAYLSGLSG